MLLGDAIRKSLAAGEPIPEFESTLLRPDRSAIRTRQEGDLWDFKERLDLNDAHTRAKVAKQILAFHNAQGGCLVVGVDNDYRAMGLPPNLRFDRVRLKQAVEAYVGSSIEYFVAEFHLSNQRPLIVIFIPRRANSPVPAQENGPQDRAGTPAFRRGDFFVRVHDESRLVQDPNDFCRLFNGFSPRDSLAYSYDVDQPMYRLLRPHCTKFFGREALLHKLSEEASRDNPLLSLDGTGGVGKSEFAIEYCKREYRRKNHDFIVSMSAKHSIWGDHQTSRKPGFTGFHEFLNGLREVLLPATNPNTPSNELADELLVIILSGRGLILVDNAESISDPLIFEFLTQIRNPTKVLVTSRIDRKLGAIPFTVPKMDDADAADLLAWELDRCGVDASEKEKTDALAVALGIPLAIKWVAQLAARHKGVSGALTAFSKESRSFRAFCLNTMFDALDTLPSQMALSYAYLGEENWTIPILAIAHESTEDRIRDAMFELQDRGLLLPGSLLPGARAVLAPEFIPYMKELWTKETALKQRIEVALGEAIGNYTGQGVFLTLEPRIRANVLLASGRDKTEKGDYSTAIKYLKAAIPEDPDNPEVLFELGRAQWRSGGQADAGRHNMWEAYKKINGPKPDRYAIWLSEAFLALSEPTQQSIGLRALADAFVEFPLNVSTAHAKQFASTLLELRQYETLEYVLRKTHFDELQSDVKKTLKDAFAALRKNDQALAMCGQALERFLESETSASGNQGRPGNTTRS
jgi:hypothetical protein